MDSTSSGGPIVTGSGYSFAAPKGWGTRDNAVSMGADTLVMDLTPTGPFASNLNVLLSPAGFMTPDVIETAAVRELSSIGALNIVVLPRVTVAKSVSPHVAANTSIGTLKYRIAQYYVSNVKQTYVVTFSFALTVPDAESTSIANSVLASWTWL